MSFAFAQHLQDFGSTSSIPQLEDLPEISTGEAEPIMATTVDVEAERAVSYQEGYTAASQTLTEEHAAKLEILTQSHADELAKKEDDIYTQVSQELMSGLASQIDLVAENVKTEVSAILMQFIEEDLVKRSIEQLDEIIKSALIDKPSSKIDITGPSKLLEKIKICLGDNTNQVNLAEAENADLTIEIDQSVLKTRLFEWHQNFGDKLS